MMKREFTENEEVERKSLKRYVAKIGSEYEVSKICNDETREYAEAVLCGYTGIGKKVSNRMLQLYRIEHPQCSVQTEQTDRTHADKDLFVFFNTCIDKSQEELRQMLNMMRDLYSKCDKIYGQTRLVKDVHTRTNDANYIVRSIKGEEQFTNKLRKRFAQQALTELAEREEDETMKRRNREKMKLKDLECEFTEAKLSTDPFAVLKKYKFSFSEVDKASLLNGWWQYDSLTRAKAAVTFCWQDLYESHKCTACTRTQLWNTCKSKLSIPDHLFSEAIDLLIESGDFSKYAGAKEEMLTSKRLLQIESNIANFVKYQDDTCRDNQYEDSLKYTYATYEYDHSGNFTERQWNIFVDDAVNSCLGTTFQLTDEQRTCILMILQKRFSIVNAKGGTGKTNVVLKVVVYIMSKLGYMIMTVTPTHAAKKPICRCLNWTEKEVPTIQSLTFDYGHGSGLYRKYLKSIFTENEYAENTEGYERHETYESDDELHTKRRIFIAMDESSMYCSEEVGAFFGELFTYKKYCMTHTCMMGDTGQLIPVNAGVPFEDLANSELFPTGVLTINHRSETKDISEFCNLFRGDCTNEWTFSQTKASESCKYVLDAPGVSHMETKQNDINFQDISQKYKYILETLKSQGTTQNNIMTITATNEDCIRMSHTFRSIFDPESESERQDIVSRLKTPYTEKGYKEGKWGKFTKNDKVCFTENCRWYKNGDVTKVLDTTYKEHGKSVKQDCKVTLKVDEETTHLFWKIVHSKNTPGDTFWFSIKNIPKELTFIENEEDENHNIIASTWSITKRAEDLKPLSCITTHKSQGDQAKYVIFIVPYAYSRRDCRTYYTPCSRTQVHLYLIGPTSAFDSPYARIQNPLPITLLQSIFPSVKQFWRISELDITEEMYVKAVMKQYRKQIPQSLRRKIWERDCGKEIYGRCGCCKKSIRFDSPDWNLCHIEARAVNESIAFEEKNLTVGCKECNLKMQIRNLFAYKAELEKKGMVKKTNTQLAKKFYDFVSETNKTCLKSGDVDRMPSERTMIKQFQCQCIEKNVLTVDLHEIIKYFLELGKMKRYEKTYNNTTFSTLQCL